MSERERIDLLSNASASSDGTHQAKVGGRYIWAIEGTFNGGSYQLQSSNANGTFTDIAGASMSAAGFMLLDIAPGTLIKAVETGTTSAMYSTLVRVPA
jgi:hypothetical protein